MPRNEAQDDPSSLSRVPHLAISSATIGGKTAYETWQESVADIFDTRPEARCSLDGFALDVSAFHPGPLLVGRFISAAQDFERSVRTIAQGGLDHFLFQLYEQGGFRGLAGRNEIRVRAGDICILDLARTLETTASAFRNTTLIVPRQLLETVVEDVDALAGVVLPGEEPLTRLLADHMRSLFVNMPLMAPDEAETAARASMALIAVSARRHARFGSVARSPLVSPLRAIVAHIDARIHDPKTCPASVCADMGISRAALYRLFEPICGVAEFIRVRRLEAAIRHLTAPEYSHLSISEIAFACGFRNVSTFSRAFGAHFGMSARQVRQGARCAHQMNGKTGNLVKEAELAYWIKTLT